MSTINLTLELNVEMHVMATVIRLPLQATRIAPSNLANFHFILGTDINYASLFQNDFRAVRSWFSPDRWGHLLPFPTFSSVQLLHP